MTPSPLPPPDALPPSLGAIPIDHVGIVVRETAAALDLYVGMLGLRAGPTEEAPAEHARLTFLQGANLRLELIEPLPGDSALARFLEKRGEGLHHVCFVVSDLAATLDQLGAAGYQLIDAQPRPGRHGELVAFVHPKSTHGVLIEFYQPSQPGVAPPSATGGSSDGGAPARDRSRNARESENRKPVFER